jgi:hypothetical protein
MSSDELLARVSVLESLEEIRSLAHRYAHHVWHQDVPAAIGLFTDDGEMHTGERPPIVGKQNLLDVYGVMITKSMLNPMVQQHVIELGDDGESATGVCYLDLRAVIGGESLMGSGYYDDCYQRIDGVWKFKSRKLNMNYLVKPGEPWAGSPE